MRGGPGTPRCIPIILERLAAMAPRRVGAIHGGMAIRTEEATEAQELGEQAQAAADAIGAAVLRLLKPGAVDPRLVVLAVVRVAGELGASAALAAGEDVEAMLGNLAEVLRQAGQDQRETLRAEMLPVMGRA